MTQLTPKQEREYVEARWMQDCLPSWTELPSAGHHIPCLIDDYRQTDEYWHAALLYTIEHERKIAEVKEEIDVLRAELKSHQRNCHHERADECDYAGPLTRLLAVEQSRLAELMRGWKGEA